MNKELFQKYISDPDNVITERSCDPEFRLINESQFSLGNGYICSRGIFEEIPKGTFQGTYFAGVFDPIASKVSELVNAPNPFDMRISIVKGEKLDISVMDIEYHQRILDMRHGLLKRHTIYKDHKGKKYDYQSLRFISMDNLNIAAMQVAITPLDEVTSFSLTSAIDTSVTNHGIIFEADTRHFHIHEAYHENSANYISVRTLAHDMVLAYSGQMVVQQRGKSKTTAHRNIDFRLRKGETIIITKYFSFCTSRDIEEKNIKKFTISVVKKATKAGFDKLIKQHIKAFLVRWKASDIIIDGDNDAQQALRFNIYHLLIATHPEVKDVSIGAKTMTGEGYKGHVFWDTEILMLPFFIFTHPLIARNLIEYRYNRIDLAKEIANQHGYKGAMFPWESAGLGLDETPTWGKGFDGQIHLIHTGKQEQHITADVFYSVITYFNATNDYDFLLERGLELAIETTRFWASRLEYNKKTDQYEITDIMGPDEFHENINNNAYTNALVTWQLKTAVSLINHVHTKYPGKTNTLLKSLSYSKTEGKKWKSISDKIKIQYDKKNKILIQFDNYLKLKHYPTPALDEYGLPEFPKQIEVPDLCKTQFIKQADVVMLIHILPELFDEELAKQNFHFYERRTLHKSSLSAAIHSAVAAQMDCEERAYHYFNVAVNADRKNVYRNTHEGIHAASLGGTWQTVIFGFCGVRILNNILTISPKLPESWRCVKFYIVYQGKLLNIAVSQEEVKILIKTTKRLNWLTKQEHFQAKRQTCIKIYDKTHHLKLNETYTFKSPTKRERYDMEGLL